MRCAAKNTKCNRNPTVFHIADNTLYNGNRRLDPQTLTWADATLPQPHTTIDATEAVRWMQKESGAPIRPPVAVLGPREASAEERATARELGRFLARVGLTVLCGGRQGVMEAVCFGVHEEGGLSIGLLPEGDWQSGNPYVSVPIATGIGIARNSLIARAALCAVAVGGGLGTISEIALGIQFGKTVFGICQAPDIPGIRAVPDLPTLEPLLCRAVLGVE